MACGARMGQPAKRPQEVVQWHPVSHDTLGGKGEKQEKKRTSQWGVVTIRLVRATRHELA